MAICVCVKRLGVIRQNVTLMYIEPDDFQCSAPEQKPYNMAHVTEIRFVIFIFEGIHKFDYFSQNKLGSDLYDFAAKEFGLQRGRFVINDEEKKRINEFKTIREQCRGSTTGRIFLNVVRSA